MTFWQLCKRLLIGALVATLPLVLCFVLAEVMVWVGVDLASPSAYQAQERRNIAGIFVIIGFVMSGVAWFGLGMYTISKLMEIGPRARHERRLHAMRERGEIDF